MRKQDGMEKEGPEKSAIQTTEYRVFGTLCDSAALSYAGPDNPLGRGFAPVAILLLCLIVGTALP